MSLSHEKARSFIEQAFESSIIPTLCEYIKIPNASPTYDPQWATNGYQEKAVELLVDWAKKQNLNGFQLEVVQLPGRTPLIFMTVDGIKTQE